MTATQLRLLRRARRKALAEYKASLPKAEAELQQFYSERFPDSPDTVRCLVLAAMAHWKLRSLILAINQASLSRKFVVELRSALAEFEENGLAVAKMEASSGACMFAAKVLPP